MNEKRIELKFPIGCTEIKFYPKTGVAVAIYESEFKRGSLIHITDSIGTCYLAIAKEIMQYKFWCYAFMAIAENHTFFRIGYWFNSELDKRLATPEESQLLFDKLASEGLKWNSETLELEKIEVKYVPKKGDFVKVTSEKSGIFSIFESDEFNNGYAKAMGSYITQNGIGTFFGGKFIKELNIFTKLTPEEFQYEFEKLGYVYDFESHTAKEIVKFENGELVLVRGSNNEIWQPRIFHSFINGELFSMSSYGNHGCSWSQYSKFDSDLLGTTKLPKQYSYETT